MEPQVSETSSNGVAPLTRDEILALDDRPVELFSVPEWRRPVYLRAPALPDVVAVLDRVGKLPKSEQALGQAKEMVRLGMCDANGNPLFTAADADVLVTKNLAALNRVAKRVTELCGMTEEPKDAGKAS